MNQETPSTHPNTVINYCPFCGAKDLESRDVNYFYCNSCHKEYFTNTAAAVAAIITDNQGRILFTRRAHDPFKGMLDLPGGFVDAGETAEEALFREIREELGSEIIEFSYFCSFPNEYPYSGLTYYTLDLAFICKLE
ncbi:MAG: NUDIX domain-containing protein, partial [Bacteroidota bacterium]|nr:NUDIX domain-containing protein [Bacteroidota bacterium]